MAHKNDVCVKMELRKMKKSSQKPIAKHTGFHRVGWTLNTRRYEKCKYSNKKKSLVFHISFIIKLFIISLWNHSNEGV